MNINETIATVEELVVRIRALEVKVAALQAAKSNGAAKE